MYAGERFNSISHAVGALLAVAGTAVLVALAARLADPWKIVAFSVYGAMLVALYAASTAYHSVRGQAKAVLRKLDHCSIYLLIAGSYTPFALVSLRGAWGWSLLGVVWGLALLGIAQEVWLARGARRLSLALYVAMGWLALVAVVPLWRALGPAGFAWLLAGGACYTVGIAFYATDHRVRHGHGWWHLFVLGGSACHFFTVLRFVALP
jgi:hemolysin III